MKRTPFKRKAPAGYVKAERIAPVYARLTVKVNMPRVSDETVTIAKAAPVRSEPYRRLVAAMPCIHCGIIGFSQAAHADMGKGAHIKSDDRTCYPACGPRPGEIGCHALIGSTGSMTRDQRRTLEADYAAQTRAEIRQSGQWPKGLPHLEIQNELELA
jgi:hypothetical protein